MTDSLLALGRDIIVESIAIYDSGTQWKHRAEASRVVLAALDSPPPSSVVCPLCQAQGKVTCWGCGRRINNIQSSET